MPLYLYECISGHKYEHLQLSISEDVPEWRNCPTCDHPARWVEFVQTAPPNTYGEGFFKQSLSGPTRRQDPTKLLNEMKQSGASFETTK
jgi:hypothetical protein